MAKLNAQKFEEEINNYEYIQLTFPNMNGISLCKFVSTRSNANDLVTDNCEIYTGSILTGPRCQVIAFDKEFFRATLNAKMVADKSTLRPLPWIQRDSQLPGFIRAPQPASSASLSKVLGSGLRNRPYFMGELFVNLQFPPSSSNSSGSGSNNSKGIAFQPRVAALTQLEKLQRAPLFATLKSGVECEFFVYHDKDGKKDDDEETKFYSGENTVRALTGNSHLEVFAASALRPHYPFLFDLVETLESHRVGLGCMHMEQGVGQVELPIQPLLGLHAADAVFQLKEAALGIGRLHGLRPTFMTVPQLHGGVASGAHFNHSLVKQQGTKSGGSDVTTNLFYDASKKHNLSLIGRQWLAGLLRHAKAMTAFCCPTVNCYRRLFVGWAPGKITCNMNNRFSAIRIKDCGGGPNGFYFENRIPSSASCSHLVMAATVTAGLLGVRNKLELSDLDEQDDGAEIEDLPKSLEEALKCLEEDTEFVEEMGSELVELFIQVKREIDLKEIVEATDCIDDEAERDKARLKKERMNYF